MKIKYNASGLGLRARKIKLPIKNIIWTIGKI